MLTSETDMSIDDPLLFADFCRSHWSRLLVVLTLETGNAAVAEELAQDALARSYLHWRKIQRMDAPEAWLYRVALNLGRSYLRRKAAERRALARLRSEAEPVDPVTMEFVGTDLTTALRRLPARQRQAVILRHYLDMSIDQAARSMDCPHGTVKTLTRRGLLTLRGQIAGGTDAR